MTQEQRKQRIIARGEGSNHAHVITGDAVIRNNNGEILIELGNEECVLKHILETNWVQDGKETWTGEHKDINLTENDDRVEVGAFIGRHGDVALKKVGKKLYKYVQQHVFDPLTKRIEAARD